MTVNNSITEKRLANALTNNTFDLEKAEIAIKKTVENSFQYLKSLQRSYISLYRFNLTNDDLYMNNKGDLCFSLDKDFIEHTRRKKYKNSRFYTEYVSFSNLIKNRDIFAYIPIIFLDGKFVSGYEVKSTLDAKTEIVLPFIQYKQTFLKESHKIEVMFVKDMDYNTFTTNKHVVEKYGWKLPKSVTKLDIRTQKTVLMTIIPVNGQSGTNMIPVVIDSDGNLVLDKTNEVTKNAVEQNTEVVIHIISSDNLFEVSGLKSVNQRINDNRLSSIVVLSSSEDGYDTYAMPIPSHNLLILKVDNTTGEYSYENNLNIIIHYPNIYEIEVDNSVDKERYSYKVFYFYHQMYDYLKFDNRFKYIYRFIGKTLGDISLEEVVTTLLYSKYDDEFIQNYFLNMFNYEDAEYLYDNGDFSLTKKPYDFDYKIEKFKEFSRREPSVLVDYAKDVTLPSTTFFLDVRNIDLEDRTRTNTFNEAEDEIDKVVFGTECYVFKFRNEGADALDLRFFVDGILVTDFYILSVKNMDYVYIPTYFINEDSYIEVEQFYSYISLNKVSFKDKITPVTIEFNENEVVSPTLYDLFVTDTDHNRIDRKLFKIYCPVEASRYDVSDYINDEVKADTIIVEGQFYVNVENIGSINISESRIPINFLELRKLVIIANDDSIINKELLFTVNKIPYLHTETMAVSGLPKIRLFNGSVPWKEDIKYLRIFINGRFVPMKSAIYEESPMVTYFIPNCYISEGEKVTVDITPFVYEEEFYLETIPDDFIVDFNGKLSKPFDFKYYDIYLNGRKLNERNVQVLSPERIALFNVSSLNNFYILRKDRDCEFFGFTTPVITPIDEFFSSSDVSEDEKEKLIEEIIYDYHNPEDIQKGTNDEPNIDVYTELPDEVYGIYRFYLDIILSKGICKPNSFYVDKDMVEEIYTSTYDTYSNKKNRVVMRPNINHDANTVLMLGKAYNQYYPSRVAKLQSFIGDEAILSTFSDKSLIDTIVDLFNRLDGIGFRVDSDTNILQAYKDFE